VNDTALVGQGRPGRTGLAPARLSQARLSEIVSSLAGRPGGWGEVVRYDAARRWYQRLELTDDHEVWLLSWLPGQSTGFHDHGLAAGAFAVAEGQVRERTVAEGQVRERTVAEGQRPLVRNLTVARGSVRTFGPHYTHDVINVTAEPALTVHAYSPPLTAMRRFELTDSGLVQTGTEMEQDW
jgi:predicted metal-dependent enzyme (double-stranded beta helix superfamily)